MIDKIRRDLSSKEALFGKSDLMEYFQDRESELNKLGTLAFSGSYSGIIILGIDGMGKTAFVRRSIYQLFSRLTPIWIDLAIASSPVRLLSTIAKPLSVVIDASEPGFDPQLFWSEKLFPEIAYSEKTFTIFDNTPGIDESINSQTMNELICRIFEDLLSICKAENPNMIIISEKLPMISEIALSRCCRLDIGELETNFMVRALDYHLSHLYSGNYNLKDLESIAENLGGYPLAIGLVSTRIVQHGIDIILEDNSFVREFFLEVARKLFKGIEISPDEKELLIIMSISYQPLNAQQLKNIFKNKWTIINRLIDYQIVDSVQDGYQVHNILKSYILSSISKKEDALRAHKILAKIFKEEWQKAPKGSASKSQYGSLAYYHTLSSGEAHDASMIKKEYLSESIDAARELYKRHQYAIAFKYLDAARKISERFEPIMDQYYSLCLYRLQRSKEALPIMQNLVEKFPTRSDYHHSLGLIQRALYKNGDAKVSYVKSIALSRSRKDKAIGLSSLADLLCYEGNLTEAKEKVLEAVDLTPYESNVISTAAKILNESGELEEALAMLDGALKKSPNDSRLHAQIGVTLKKMGSFKEARDHLEVASLNPALSFTLTALADVYIQLNDIKKAEIVIENMPGNKENNASYLSIKANILRLKENYYEAERLINKAIDLEPRNRVHYGLLSKIKLNQAIEAISNQDKNNAITYLYSAEGALFNGLKLDNDDPALLSIKHSIDEFKIKKLGIAI